MALDLLKLPAPELTDPNSVRLNQIITDLNFKRLVAGAVADYEEGAWTAALTGTSGTVSVAAFFTRLGKLITLFIPHLVGASNANTCTIIGLPAALNPTRAFTFLPFIMNNNAISSGSGLVVKTNGVIQLYVGGTTVFTASGNKGLFTLTGADNYSFTYTLR